MVDTIGFLVVVSWRGREHVLLGSDTVSDRHTSEESMGLGRPRWRPAHPCARSCVFGGHNRYFDHRYLAAKGLPLVSALR